MKFIFLAPRYHTNQIGLLKKLIESGHEIKFYVHTIGKTEDHSLVKPKVFPPALITRIFGNGGNTKPLFLPKIAYFFSVIKSQNPDFIVIRDPSRLFSLYSAVLCRIFFIRIIFYSQRDLSENISKKRIFFEKIFLFLFNAIWISPIQGNIEKNKSYHLQYVPFCVDQRFFSNVEKLTGPIRILSIGKMHDRKEHFLLIDALLQCVNLDWSLTIVGESSSLEQEKYKEKLIKYIKDLGIDDKVNVSTNIAHERITKYYEQSDIFILPAKNEPASISVLEAMASGLPVICSDSCGTKSYINSGLNGYIFETSNKNSLSEKIELLSNRREIGEMGSASQTIAYKKISGNVFLEYFKKVIFNKWKLNI